MQKVFSYSGNSFRYCSVTAFSMTLPDLNISISRFYPFKRKKMAGKERWYEKISMSYTGQLSNSITTKEDKLLHSSLTRDWRNGMQHNIPISGNFTLFNYLNINPSLNFTDRMYTNKARMSRNCLGLRCFLVHTEMLSTMRSFQFD